jgi:hypothetical protein
MRPGILAAFAVLFLVPSSPAQQSDTIQWLTDRKKAFAEAKRTGKPIWALFR